MEIYQNLWQFAQFLSFCSNGSTFPFRLITKEMRFDPKIFVNRVFYFRFEKVFDPTQMAKKNFEEYCFVNYLRNKSSQNCIISLRSNYH